MKEKTGNLVITIRDGHAFMIGPKVLVRCNKVGSDFRLVITGPLTDEYKVRRLGYTLSKGEEDGQGKVSKN